MARGAGNRVRPKVSKARRWRKGQSSSSNPETKQHRQAAKGKFGTHLSQGGGVKAPSELPLTVKTLASHNAVLVQGEDDLLLDRGDSLGRDDDSITLTSVKSLTSGATSTVYSLMETAHPVFRKLKRLWNSPLESHREVCAVLAALSEVVKTHNGKDSETEYFGALMTALESSEDEKSTMAVAFLLSLILPRVPQEVLQTRYSAACKIIADKLTLYEMSDSTSLLKSLVKCLIALLEAQTPSTWSEGYTKKVFQLFLNYTVHPKPRLRKAAQFGIVSLLKEGTLNGNFHPSSSLVARHCEHVIDNNGLEAVTLHVLGMLKDCLANFPNQLVKTLCESLLNLMTLGHSIVRTTGLKVLHGLFSSTAGPQGLTSDLNAQLISALYDYQPNLVDTQLLQAWLTVILSAHTKLFTLNSDLLMAHLPKLFVTCVGSLLSDKQVVLNTAASVMETLLSEVIPTVLSQLGGSDSGDKKITKESKSAKSISKTATDHPYLIQVKAMFKAMELGLKYKYCTSWGHVLKVLGVFYKVAGYLKQCQKFMTKSLETICDLRGTPDFPFKSELDSAFGAAVRSMGVRVVLTAVPLQLDPDHSRVAEAGTPDFPRSWMLPVLRECVGETELAYFANEMLPLAGKLRTKSVELSRANNLLEAKLYDTLQLQVWSLLPGFCTNPVDLCTSFNGIARILGTALKEKAELRCVVCHSLKLLIESSRDKEENQRILAQFSKNYLPILFELYVSDQTPKSDRASLLDCVKAYVSITDQTRMESFFTSALSKLDKEEVLLSNKQLLFDLILSFLPYLSQCSLSQVFTKATPLLDAGNSALQKKAYSCMEGILSHWSPAHQAFRNEHIDSLRQILLESLSTVNPASKRPRLKCLMRITDHLTPEYASFITAVVPEVILCAKEVNERTRQLSFKVLVSMGYAAQRCYNKNAEESVMDYIVIVLAGLAGSSHMIAATILALSRLVYEFHDLLRTEFLKRLLSIVCTFLRSRTREVVRSTLEFIKVIIGVLPADELLSHLEDLVRSITSWNEDNQSHFRLKCRDILEKLVKKFSYEIIESFVPDKHKKLILHIRKMLDRQLKKKKQAREKRDTFEDVEERKTHKPSYEELLMDSSDDENEEEKKKRTKAKGSRGRGVKQVESGRGVAQSRGRAWIKESSGDDPVDFLDPGVVQNVVATDPAKSFSSRKPKGNPFKTNEEGKLVIAADDCDRAEADDGIAEMDGDEKELKIKRKFADNNRENPSILPQWGEGSSGRGIYRKNPRKRDLDFDYGSEYKAKKAKGDVKKKDKPDPYAYVPLLRQKLNKRKEAKFKGQFSGLLKKAKKGSAAGLKKQIRRNK